MSALWSGKPFLKKTLVKFALIFVIVTILLSFIFVFFPILIPFWLAFSFIFLVFYYFNKKAFTYYISDKSVRIEKSWIFGNYVREITFDQVRDVHVMQGIIARIFNCGSLVFVTSTGLEVGYAGGGAAVGRGVIVGGGGVSPTIVKGRGNMFWDILDPGRAREILMGKLTEWREVYQQQKIAVSVEKMAERTAPSTQQSTAETIADKLEKLKKLLDTGAITKEEYEKAKKKLLE
ncbi:MAG: SHOCT domain-containing protein [Conexivisphaerales archaeon]